MGGIIALIIIVILLIIVLGTSIRIIQQQRVGVLERLGKFHRTMNPGPHLMVPFVDRIRYNMDMRERVIPFPPQGVITEDNLMVSIDSVIYFQVIDPVRAAYEAQDYIRAIEQLTMTTLRNIIGGLDLEQTLTSREEINGKLRVVLDEATGKWGIKVNRVELRAIDPPPTIRDAMEKGARAERDKRAQILLAEGQRQSQILSAGGEKESAILRAQGEREAAVLRAQADRQSQMLRAEGEAQAISTVFNAIHAGQPDQALLSYQYMQMLPQIARGDANKVWVVPSEIGKALEGLGGAFGQQASTGSDSNIPTQISGEFKAPEKIDVQAELAEQKVKDDAEADKRVQEAIAAAQELERDGGRRRTKLNPGQQEMLGIGGGEPTDTAPAEPAPGDTRPAQPAEPEPAPQQQAVPPQQPAETQQNPYAPPQQQ
ncbi:SPFH/Band 7/PHB domain protein [Microlunatus elymi]|uniref:SPFH/Band 7/PHB domain protein n=1 Tax=Microlunatus elymi TaxID=2596828 RepID=A0A516Q252_9ACTN|nr:SPFH domain-containing protein [Microlunatus elymi]QDP97452.1 SPFH/Band 7/PHB domain protein [Microlunatus elymi]